MTRWRRVIAKDGSVTEIVIARSSGYQVLDRAAIAAIKNSSPFPAPTKELSLFPLALEVDIIFELT